MFLIAMVLLISIRTISIALLSIVFAYNWPAYVVLPFSYDLF